MTTNGTHAKSPDAWQDSLLYKTTKAGPVLRPILANAALILAHDAKWSGVLAYDEFAETIIARKLPPWRKCDVAQGGGAGDWNDEDTSRVQCWLSERYDVDIGAETALAAVKLVAHRTRVHPVREWLETLRWDGEKRLPTWLVDVFGCDDTPYVRAVGQAWAISAVARAYRPGCKVDTVLVLEGKPGTFKSSVLRALVGDAWFIEMSISDVANKDAMQVLRRKWIGEFPEIDGLSRTEQAAVKSYFSRQVDTYRASYGKGARDYPRQTVFAATTNKEQYLTDETGGTGRRMWPVRCARGDVSAASQLRDQFWAEARVRLEANEEWHIRDPELRDAEREEQDARFRVDPWEEKVATWLAKPIDAGRPRSEGGVTTADVLANAIMLETSRQGHADAGRIGAILRRLGWVPSKHPESRNGARVRIYRPQDGAGTNGHTLLPLEAEPPTQLPLGEDSFPPPASDRAFFDD